MERPFPPSNLVLQPPETAVWIGSPHPFDLHEVYLNFRAPVWQWNGVGRVRLWMTADSRYKLWVNGVFVQRGPARSYPWAQKVDEVEITDALRVGENQLAVQVYQPGYSHFSAVHRGAAGVLAWWACDGRVVGVTNGRWRVQRDLSFADDVARVSIYGSGVERRDWRRVEGWETAVYDDSHWAAARVVDGGANGAIWSGLQRREMPMMTERVVPLVPLAYRCGALVGEGHEGVKRGWETAVVYPIVQDEAGWLTPATNTPTHYWLFDLGRAYTCQGVVDIVGASGGERVAVSYADKMVAGDLVISDSATYCRVQLTDFFTLRPGGQTVASFALRGGRYLLFQLASATSALKLRFQARVAETAEVFKTFAVLETGDDLLDKVVAMCENTVRACLQDSFVDCVWRESSQWVGDALVQGLVLTAMGGDMRPIRTVLWDAAQGIYPDGLLPSVAPAEVHAYTIPRYSCMWVELLGHYWRETADFAFLTHLWPTLKRVLAAVQAHQDERGLLIHPPGRRFYIDWSATAQCDPHLVYNLHVVLALQRAAELAGAFEPEMTALWQGQAERLLGICRQGFGENGRYYDDLAHTTCSQLGAAMALLTGAAAASERESLLAGITARSLDKDGVMVLASPFMHHYLFEALGENGRFADIITIIKYRWGQWVACPTTWENWNVDFPDGSQCHAFSAHPRYHLAKIFSKIGRRFS